MNLRFTQPLIIAVLSALSFLPSPSSGDLLEVAIAINGNIYACDWLYRDVHEWARENGSPKEFLASQKAVDVETIKASLENIELALEEAEEHATPATYAATAAFAAAQRTACRTALSPGGGMDSYASNVERELARARSLRSDLEMVFGRSLTSARTTDPKVYAAKKAAWEAHLKEKEATDRRRAKSRQAAIDQWQKERREQQRAQQSKSQERQRLLQVEEDKRQAAEEARLAEEQAELKKQMTAWHARYKARVAGVKSSLGRVLGAMQENDDPTSLLQSCRRLQSELRGIDGKGSVLQSPDTSTTRYLSDAYQHMRGLAASCMQGHMPEMRKELDSVKVNLGEAAQALAVYELRP